MSNHALAAGIRHFRGKMAVQCRNDESDEHLLHAFTSRRDEDAFAVLVRRHGPMVLHVCRRVLGHEHDAEDAFQATFLVLAQGAAGLRKQKALAGFLHGTAYRMALAAKRSAARRRKHEGAFPRAAGPGGDPADELSWREVRTLIDEEIARLPEKYRTVFVLCCLENLSQAEAARRLGMKERTLSSWLMAARKRLGQRLARRGVALTAALSAALWATQPAAALAAGLVATTVEAAVATATGEGLIGVVSASVAELVKGMTAAMVMSKAKIATALLLTATLLAGAGAWTCRTLATPQSVEQQADADKSPLAATKDRQASHEDKGKEVMVRGRVLDPDGKPVKGARLYWPRVPKTEPKSAEDIEIPERAKTDAAGRFRFELPRSDIKPEWRLALIAAADGYGVAWAEWPAIKAGSELTLRVVKDQSIEGRIVSMEGKPLAGVSVRIDTLGAMSEGKVDAFLAAWKRRWRDALFQNVYYQNGERPTFLPLHKILKPATTDKDGHFLIAGAGTERLAVLSMRGSSVVPGTLYVINRAGFDAVPVNKAVLDHIPAEHRLPGDPQYPPLLYGPELTYVVPPSRRIEGTVREAGSGKPVAGYTISTKVRSAVSDKEGRYQLSGVPKMKQYLLSAAPPTGTSWLSTSAGVTDAAGLQPLTIDFTVARGVLLTGRVREKSTGKAVAGGIYFVPLPGNKFAGKPGYDSGKDMKLVGADGRFTLAVIPGRGMLIFEAEKLNDGRLLNPYKQTELDAKDREHVKITVNDFGDLQFTDRNNQPVPVMNAAKYLDLAADAETATCDLFVDRGLTKTVKIEDSDSKPLKGTTVAGVTACWPITFPIMEATCTVFALDPKKPRRLLLYHAGRNLAASLTVRGDEKGPLLVRLRPTGSLTGHVLNRDGQPLAGVDVNLATRDSLVGEIYRMLDHRGRTRQVVRTGKDGSYRLDGVVPDVKFTLVITQGRRFLVGEPRIGARAVKPGETLDLGDVRVKPGP